MSDDALETESIVSSALKCAQNSLNLTNVVAKEVDDHKVLLDQLNDNLKSFDYRIRDLKKHSNSVKQNVDKSNELTKNNDLKYKQMKEDFKTIKMLFNETKALLHNNFIAEIDVLREEIIDNMEKMDRMNIETKDLSKILNETMAETKHDLNKISPSLLDEARSYAMELDEASKKYGTHFQNTKDGAEVALAARLVCFYCFVCFIFKYIFFCSNAHTNILKAIDTARESGNEAIKAAEQSKEVLEPVGQDSIFEQANESLSESKLIKMDAQLEAVKLEGTFIILFY